jgi:hypothetical protein
MVDGLPIGYAAIAYRPPRLGEPIYVGNGIFVLASELHLLVHWLVLEARDDGQTRSIQRPERQVNIYRGAPSSQNAR